MQASLVPSQTLNAQMKIVLKSELSSIAICQALNYLQTLCCNRPAADVFIRGENLVGEIYFSHLALGLEKTQRTPDSYQFENGVVF